MATGAPPSGIVPLPVHLAVVTVDPVAGTTFLDTVCGSGAAEVRLDNAVLRLFLVAYEAGQEGVLENALAAADGVALLVSHVDAISMDTLKAAYRALPTDLPTTMLILRDAGKVEFKLSCPACGQKLWVRDEDQGRAGRCPHCKKTFVLPGQAAHIRSLLMLPDSVPLVTVTQGHQGACRGPIAALGERTRMRAQVLKSATMRVQVTDTAAGDIPRPHAPDTKRG